MSAGTNEASPHIIDCGVAAIPLLSANTDAAATTPSQQQQALLKLSLRKGTAADHQAPRHTILNLIFDNSASMGDSTRVGLQALAQPLMSLHLFEVTLLTLFDTDAQCFLINSPAALQHLLEFMPPQRATNITAGVEVGMCMICELLPSIPYEWETESVVHIVTVMLTDGEHNTGPTPSKARFLKTNQELMEHASQAGVTLLHSVIMACLTNNSDATLSMIVKGSFESVHLPALPNVFYASTHQQMAKALGEVVQGCRATFAEGTARFVQLRLSGGGKFLSTDTAEIVVLLQEAQDEEESAEAKKKREQLEIVTFTADSVLIVNNGAQQCKISEMAATPPEFSLVCTALQMCVASVTRASVAEAGGPSTASVASRIHQIEEILKWIGTMQEEVVFNPENGFQGLSPQERRALLRQVRGTTHELQTLRHTLQALKVQGRSNNDKIALLTGNSMKFAAIAAARSKSEGRAASEVMANLAAIRPKLRELIAEDAARLVANKANVEVMPRSLLSLQGTEELLDQFLEDIGLNNGQDDNDEAIFEILCSFGLLGVPVKISHSACSQVDPMQMHVECTTSDVVDTASMMLAWKMNQSIRLPCGHSFVDVVPLVDPAFPSSTLFLLKRAMWADHLFSAICARDLYMFLPSMPLALHTHMFQSVVQDLFAAGNGIFNESAIKLALGILYSASKLVLSKSDTSCEQRLVTRWMNDLQSVTRSEADQVDHPAFLQLLFAVFAGSVVNCSEMDDFTAMLNLFNEVIARHINSVVGDNEEVAFCQKLLNIAPCDAPCAKEDPFEPEPTMEAVRAACPKAVCFSEKNEATLTAMCMLGVPSNVTTLCDWVESMWAPFYNCHRFVLALLGAQPQATQPKTTAALFAEMEQHGGTTLEMVGRVKTALASTEPSVWQWLGLDRKEASRTALASVVQGALMKTARQRAGRVTSIDVTDAVTLREMVEQLHFAHYQESLREKMRKFARQVGDATRAQSKKCDLATLAELIGVHTHGHTSDKFWGFIEGIVLDENVERREEKIELFKSKTGQIGIDRVIEKAKRRT